MLQAVVREFADRELKPRAREMDEKEEFSWEVWRSMVGLGLAGIGVDPAFGGSGGSHRQMVIAIQEVSRGDAASAVNLLAHRSLGTGDRQPVRERRTEVEVHPRRRGRLKDLSLGADGTRFRL